VTISGVGFQSLATVCLWFRPSSVSDFYSATNLRSLRPLYKRRSGGRHYYQRRRPIAVLTNGFVFVGGLAIMWTNPAAVTYGAALGPGQLNASANVPGNFLLFSS